MSKYTPITDYLEFYSKSDISRFHMPGHKGIRLHGSEHIDITEIKGADYLFESSGIILQSECNTASLFNSASTLFSTEGSSLSIKTMLAVAMNCIPHKSRFKIICPRNCHRAFINGCILLDIDPVWVYPSKPSSTICSCEITASDIDNALMLNPDCKTVYITSPDYPGNLADIKGISDVCKKHGAYLLVDNAHGAYLKFSGEKLHPLDLGADMCCDSAHKTLPVYTGGSYLHISKTAPECFKECAKETMSLFASTSPSYLIMSSLDLCANELKNGLAQKIEQTCSYLYEFKDKLRSSGWETGCGEPMKITIYPNSNGYDGNTLAEKLREYKIECEYSDPSCLVLMPSPYNSKKDFERLLSAFSDIPKKKSEYINSAPDMIVKAEKAMSLREAFFSPSENIPCNEAVGRICSKTAVSCQPSIPLIAGGEIFNEKIIKILKSYSIFTVNVVK